jgi:orotate phosphoribosyltransferase
VIALNRQEKGTGELSAIQEVERDYRMPVISIVSLSDLIDYLTEKGDKADELASIRKYRDEYGIEG